MRSKQISKEGSGVRLIARFWLVVVAWLVGFAGTSKAHAALVFPEQAIQVRSTGAVLAATITLTDGPGKAWFEYGLGTNLNLRSAEVSIPSATNLMRLRIPIGGLQAGNLVRYRAVFSNATETVLGQTKVFTTGLRLAAWGEPSQPILQSLPVANDVIQVEAFRAHALVLKADGSVMAFGDNRFGQCDVPSGLRDVVAVAAGGDHSLALKSDGTVVGWGYDIDGQSTIPEGLTNVVGIAAGDVHSVAVRDDGAVITWGRWSDEFRSRLTGLSNIVSVATALWDRLILTHDGKVLLFPGSTQPPTLLGSNLSVLRTARYAPAGILEDGRLTNWWGSVVVDSSQRLIPELPRPTIDSVSSATHALALSEAGQLTGWSSAARVAARPPVGMTRIASVASLYDVSMAVAANVPPEAYPTNDSVKVGASVVIWLAGEDVNRDLLGFRIKTAPRLGVLRQRLGTGEAGAVLSAGMLVGDSSGRVIYQAPSSLGDDLTDEFTYAAWDGDLESEPSRVSIRLREVSRAVVQPATQITSTKAVLGGFACPNGIDSVAWFEWGISTNLGNRTPIQGGLTSSVPRWISSQIQGLDTSSIHFFRLAVSNATGTVRSRISSFITEGRPLLWPTNGSVVSASVGPAPKTIQIAASDRRAHLVQSDGTVVSWGSDSFGGVTIPASATGVVMIAAGPALTAGLLSDGRVRVWTVSSYGASNAVAGITNAVAVAAGYYHGLALLSDGSVRAFGFNQYSQATVPLDVTNAVAIACGHHYSAALLADGTLRTWGTGIPPSTTPDVAIFASDSNYLIALTDDGNLTYLSSELAGEAGAAPIVAFDAGDNSVGLIRADGSVTGSGASPPWPAQDVVTNVFAVQLALGADFGIVLATNVPPVALPTEVRMAANEDRIIDLPGTDANRDSLRAAVVALPSRGYLFHVESGKRGGAITSVPTLLAGSRVIFVPAADETGVAYDSFQFQVFDGQDYSGSATVVVSVSGSPLAATREATVIPGGGARLEGMLSPRGLPTEAWFEWGNSTNYGSRSAPQSFSGGQSLRPVTFAFSNISPSSVLHFRLVSSNQAGVAFGHDAFLAGATRTFVWGNVTNIPSGMTNLMQAAAGSSHVIVLRDSGRPAGWGRGNEGQTNAPASATNLTKIAAGGNASYAVRDTGIPIGWGTAATEVTNMLGVWDIAGFNERAIGLRTDGTLVGAGIFSPVTNQTNVVGISVGSSHEAVVDIEGNVFAWRSNGIPIQIPQALQGSVAKITVGDQVLGLVLRDGAVATIGLASGQYQGSRNLTNRYARLEIGAGLGAALSTDGLVETFPETGSSSATGPSGSSPASALAVGSGFAVVLRSNLPPIAFSVTNRTKAGPPAVIQLMSNDPNGDPIRFRIMELPFHGRLFQMNGASVGEAITNAGSVVSDPLGRVAFQADGFEFGIPYSSFAFLASDDQTDSAIATVTVEVDAATTAHTLPPWVLGPDQARLHGMFMARIPSAAWIEWGVSNAFDRVAEILSANPASTNRYIDAVVSNLTINTEFRFRLVVSNEAGIYRSLAQSFMTGGRVVQWGTGTAAVPGGSAGISHLANLSGLTYTYRAAIRNNGRPVVWTAGSSGLGTIPASATNVVALSGGAFHLLALRSDGTLVAWGNNSFGQGAVPNGLSNVVAIASGDAHNFALRRDGSMVVWGIGSAGVNSVPAAATNVVSMAGGFNHSAVLTEEGRVITWGNSSSFANPPSRANGLFRRMASATEQIVALNSNGTMVAWGKDTATSFLPSGFDSIGAGPNSAYGIRTNGTLVVGWGTSPSGQPSGLGAVVAAELSANYGLALQPNRLPVVTNQFLTTTPATDVVVSLAAGDPDLDPLVYRIAQLPARGRLFQALGGGRGAQITTNDTPITDTFLLRVIYAPDAGGFGADYGSFKFSVSDGDAVASTGLVTVAVQGRALAMSQAIQADGPDSVRLSGFVSSGRLEGATWFEWGDDTNYAFRTAAVPFGTNDSPFFTTTTVSNLALGQTVWSRLVASNGSGVVYAQPRSVIFGSGLIGWGKNDFGQGGGPGVGAGLTSFISAAAGGGFNLGLRVDGTVHAWGQDKFGLLKVPASATGVVSVAAGTNHAVALRRDGSLVVWGSNFRGQTDVPATATGVVAVAAGADHTLVLRNDRTIVAWGANDYGQASAPGGETRFAGLAAGDFHSLGLRIDGSQTYWGSGSSGQDVLGTGLVEVAAGSLHTINLDTNGVVRQWGLLGTNIVASNVVAISAKGLNSGYRSVDGTWALWGSNRYAQLTAPESVTNSPAVWIGYGQALAYGGNLGPVALPTIANGVANSDLVVALKASDANGGGLGFEVLSLPAVGRLFQFQNSARGAEIVSTPATVADAGGRIVFVPETDSYGPSNAVFSFGASDGVSPSAAAPVVVNLSPGNQFAWTADPGRITGATARLRGVVGYGGVESSAWFDLVDETGFRSTSPQLIPRGKNMTRVEEQVTGLTIGTILEHRLVVSNVAGVFPGNFRRLVTAGKLRQDTGLGLVRQQTDVVSAQSGPAHVLAVLTNGTVFASGNSGDGRLNVPPGLSGIVAVAGGSTSSYALSEDGTLTGWGALPPGFPTNSGTPTNLVSVAALADAVYGVDRRGVVQGFGPLPWGPYAMPAGLSNVVAVQIEPAEVRAILLDGSVVAWGATNIGLSEIGPSVTNVAGLSGQWVLRRDGTISSMLPLAPNLAAHVSTITNARAIATAGQGPVAILADGASVTLAIPPVTNASLAIAQFSASPNYPVGVTRNLVPTAPAAAVSNVANSDLTVTLTGTDPENDPVSFRVVSLPAKGRLFQFSGSGRGAEIVSVPALVSDAGKRVIFAPAVDEAGSPYDGFQFDAGDGVAFSSAATVTVSVTASPATIFPLPLVSVRQSGATFNALVAPGVVSGKAWFEWGTTPDLGNSTASTVLPAGSTRMRFSAGTGPLVKGQVYSFRLVVSNSVGIVRGPKQRFIAGGKAAVWSGRTRGPADVNPGFDDLVSLAAGENHNLGIRLDGTVVGWGTNDAGQLNPSQGLADVIQVAAGGRHSLALKSDGTVVAWGANNNGQTTVPPSLSDVISIAASTSNSFALKSDGTMIGWGTGLGTIATNVVAIGASGDGAGYLNAIGGVTRTHGNQFWGSGISGGGQPALGLLGISSIVFGYVPAGGAVATAVPSANRAFPAAVSNGVFVAAGAIHLLAVDESGRVFAGGANTNDQVYVPVGVSNAVMVAAAGSRSIALVPNLSPSAWSDVVAIPNSLPVELRLAASDPSGDPLNLEVMTLPATGSLHQWTVSGPGTAITTVPSGVLDPLGRLFYLPSGDLPMAGTELLRFRATDGQLVSGEAAITVEEPKRPFVSTGDATVWGPGAFRMEGFAVPNGMPAIAWFEWGLNRQVQNRTTPTAIGQGRSVIPLNAPLTGLVGGRAYFFRLMASNAVGVTAGNLQQLVNGGRGVAWAAGATAATNVPSFQTGFSKIAVGYFATHLLTTGLVASSVGDFTAFDTPLSATGVVSLSAGYRDSGGFTTAGSQVSAGIFRDLAGSVKTPVVSFGDYYKWHALLESGLILPFGSYIGGPVVVPYGMTDVVSVGAGPYLGNSFAVRADGGVFSWNNTTGMTNSYPEVTNAVLVSVSRDTSNRDHVIAILRNGRVMTLSGNSFVVPPEVADITNATSVAAGGRFAVVTADGRVIVWPTNGLPATPAAAEGAAAVAVGQNHVVALVPANPVLVPRLVSSPQDVTMPYGGSTSLTAVATGTAPLSFQWMKDGVPLGGADQATLPLNFGTRLSEGQYSVMVANEADSISSSPATVRVLVPQLAGTPRVMPGGRIEFEISDAVAGGLSQTNRLTVEASPELGTEAVWTPLPGPVQLLGGRLIFSDHSATNFPRRFYRVIEL